MESRPHPSRFIRRATLAGLAAALVLAGSGCSDPGKVVGPAPAATVNGTEISQDQVEAAVKDFRKFIRLNADVREAEIKAAPPGQFISNEQFQENKKKALAPYKVTDGTYPTAGAAEQLTLLIEHELYVQALDEAGITLTTTQKDQARADVTAQFQQQGIKYTKIPKAVRQRYMFNAAATAALREEAPKKLTDALDAAAAQYEAQLREIYDSQPETFNQFCGRVIGTADEASAIAAGDRIAAGEDFTDVGLEVSVLDPSALTSPQCIPVASISQVFGPDGLKAVPGDMLGPVQDGQGFVLFVLDEEKPAAFEVVRETLAGQVPDDVTQQAQQAIDDHVYDSLWKGNKIKVDPRYGTWDRKERSVKPPTAPTTTTESSSKTTTAPATTIPDVAPTEDPAVTTTTEP